MLAHVASHVPRDHASACSSVGGSSGSCSVHTGRNMSAIAVEGSARALEARAAASLEGLTHGDEDGVHRGEVGNDGVRAGNLDRPLVHDPALRLPCDAPMKAVEERFVGRDPPARELEPCPRAEIDPLDLLEAVVDPRRPDPKATRAAANSFTLDRVTKDASSPRSNGSSLSLRARSTGPCGPCPPSGARRCRGRPGCRTAARCRPADGTRRRSG